MTRLFESRGERWSNKLNRRWVSKYDTETTLTEMESDWDTIKKVLKLPKATREKLITTMDTALASTKASLKSGLIWTKLGALLGEGSKVPHEAYNHFWKTVQKQWGVQNSSHCFIYAGSIMRWRLLCLSGNDTWWLYKQDTGNMDTSGNLIHVSCYYVDNSRTPVLKGGPPSGPSLAGLTNKFN